MTSELKVDKITPASGTNTQIGESGDTINIVGTLQNNGASVGVAGIVSSADATAITIDSSENVGIGTGSPSQKLHVAGGNPVAVIESTTSSGAFVKFENTSSSNTNRIGYAVHDFVVDTDGSEKFRIDSSGNIMFNTTNASTGTDPGVVIPSSQPSFLLNNSTTSAGVSLILLRSSYSSADETKFEVTAAGNVKSRSNSYGSFSDERIKEQIADASSQWTDIKNVKVRNFKFKSESLSGENNPKMLGVVAQELEASNMSGLVENEVLYTATDFEVINKEKNVGDIKSHKTVKYSILYMKAIKALQEAMTRIETLEAKVKTLEES